MLITFSGLDGSGKTTLIDATRRLLEKRSQPVTVLTMYDDITMYALARWCRDRVRAALGRRRRGGSPGGTVSADRRGGRGHLARRLVYAIARHPVTRACVLPLDVVAFACRSLYERRVRGRVLVVDRYFYDSLADLASDGRLAWLYIAVVLRLVPRPAAPVFVDVTPETAYARKQEYPVDYMHWRRGVYRRIFAAVPGALVIENYDGQAALEALEVTLGARLGPPVSSGELVTWNDSGSRR
ncbi:MAG: hypothetical protein A2X36_02410 [Elusimicrobia bacterium GWA2_69_24]|nr:MAG: hypothetical protein A2W08_17150 [Candidatus Rokubacteria bacterium RBG_16_73_20]OGR60896.1 MAG: hypothetical protein A2X36_02410 [Elusimicrobia bacterium GWA2_69_24]